MKLGEWTLIFNPENLSGLTCKSGQVCCCKIQGWKLVSTPLILYRTPWQRLKLSLFILSALLFSLCSWVRMKTNFLGQTGLTLRHKRSKKRVESVSFLLTFCYWKADRDRDLWSCGNWRAILASVQNICTFNKKIGSGKLFPNHRSSF